MTGQAAITPRTRTVSRQTNRRLAETIKRFIDQRSFSWRRNAFTPFSQRRPFRNVPR